MAPDPEPQPEYGVFPDPDMGVEVDMAPDPEPQPEYGVFPDFDSGMDGEEN